MTDDLMEKIKSYVSYYDDDYHSLSADPHLKNLMLEDMYKILKEIVDLNNKE